jgi:hypothetical protein
MTRRNQAVGEAQAQLALGNCATDLLRARTNLQALVPDSPLLASLDDKIRHLRLVQQAARQAPRAEAPFPCL